MKTRITINIDVEIEIEDVNLFYNSGPDRCLSYHKTQIDEIVKNQIRGQIISQHPEFTDGAHYLETESKFMAQFTLLKNDTGSYYGPNPKLFDREVARGLLAEMNRLETKYGFQHECYITFLLENGGNELLK